MKSLFVPLSYLLVSVSLVACGGSDNTASTAPYYQPSVGTSWQIQLTGTLNTDYAVAVYDVDLFDTEVSQISALQRAGKKVICYFSAGSFEDWREDAGQFTESDYANSLDGWEGEYWLNITSDNVRNIMLSRIALAQEKGCDGVDPDNVDGYQNDTGLDLTYSQQLEYNRFLADSAHGLGLAVGLKNDLGQIADLVDSFDFAVNEECFSYSECELLSPFIEQNKPVFHIEYDDVYVSDDSELEGICTSANEMGFSTLIMPLDLDDTFRISCQEQ